jgi:hypothetical protein
MSLTHEDKTHRITQGVRFVWPRHEEGHRCTMQRLIHSYCINIRVLNEIAYKSERGHAGQTPGLG